MKDVFDVPRPMLLLAVLLLIIDPAVAQTPPADGVEAHALAMGGKPASARRAYVESRLDELGLKWSRVETRPRKVGDETHTSLETHLGPDDGPALVLCASIDVRAGSMGHNRNASGCAVLLEVVAGLVASPPPAPVHVLFLDGTNSGLAGSRDWVGRHDGELVRAVISFELCGIGDTVVVGPTKIFGGNIAVDDITPALALLDPAVPHAALPRIAAGDHKIFLAAGVDAITVSVVPGRSLAAIQTRFSGRGRGRLPEPYRDALVGRDADPLDAGALKLAVRAGLEIAGRLAARRDHGVRVCADASRRRRAFVASLAEAKLPDLRRDARDMGHRTFVRAVADAIRKGGQTEVRARQLLSKLLGGKELRAALTLAAPSQIAERYAGFRRSLVWDDDTSCFRLKVPPANRKPLK